MIDQRGDQVGQEGGRDERHQLPAQAHGLRADGRRVVPPPQLGQQERVVAERGGQLAGEADGLLADRHRRRATPHLQQQGCLVTQ
ncbi:hypothetical protein [Nonomuraea sp. NPDC001699]